MWEKYGTCEGLKFMGQRGYKPQGGLVPERELGLSFSEDGLYKARSITISRLADGKSRH